MSLRIRSTKTELEDLGEDAEGAAENVSKLREQMLALTGVDIQLDKNTYKSTYQILLEMSKVWDKLDDMSRASVLDQLFGKRQANIGAAILSNGELLQQVYETSEKASDGIGSAMREQEEYAKSIQYNLDSLKASYQQLAQEIVQSETVVTIIKALNEGLQSLGSSDIVVGINAVSQSLITLTKTALDAKEKIESLPAIGGLAEMGLDRVRGVSFLKAAGKIYDLFNKNKKAAEEAARKQEELNVNYEKSSKIYDEETDNLQNLASEYLKLAANTEDVESAKEGLIALQSNVAEQYGDEADGLNLVNKSLEENVKWLIERQKVLDESFVKENEESIEQAKKQFGVENYTDKSKYGQSDLSLASGLRKSDFDDEAKREAKLYVREVSEYLKKNYSDIFKNNITEMLYGFDINAGLTPAEQKRTAEAIGEAYEQVFAKYKNLKNQVLNTDEIGEDINEWISKISKGVDILEKATKATEDANIIKSFIGNKEDSDRFSKLLLELNQYNEMLNSDTSSLAEKIDASNNLGQTVDALNEIAQKYPAITDFVNQEIQSIGLTFDHVTDTFETAKSAWLKSLDEAQKGVVANVDKITEAMKKIYQGEAIDSKSAWDILNVDNNKLLTNIQIDANGNYRFDLKELIQLKDKLIAKEIEHQEEIINTAKINKESAEAEVATAKIQLEAVKVELAAAKAPNSMATNVAELENKYNRLENGISATEDAINAYNYAIRNASLYSDELRSRMGDLSETTAMLEAQIKGMQKEVSKLKDEVSKLNTEAEARLKAQEHAVDGIIDKLQDEVDKMEKGKTELEDQLKILEEQKENLEEIVNNYKTAGDVVDNTINKQIEEIEENRKQVEDYYNSLIDKLKQENDEREDAIELQQKLANLENAKNNKVRSYDKERGWTYAADKEAIQKAQNELDEVKKNQEIKALEAKRDAKLKGYDDQIDGFEQYAKEWKAIIEDIENADNERIAKEILGSDWREKIKSKDTDILGKYKTNYASYTTQLKTLTNNEIKYLNDSIKAKEKEIETKKKEIQVWNDYKTEISNAAKEVKDKLEDYNKYLNEVEISENSTNDTRVQNLETFKTKYSNLIDEISKKNSQIENTEKQITSLTNAMNKLNEAGNSVTTSSTPVMGGIANGVAGALTGSGVFEAIISALQEAFNKLKTSIPHFAKGGSAGFTGYAWMDGSPNSSETVFTAAQSKKLYDYVNNMPEFSRLFGMNPNLLKGKTTNNSSSVNIGQMTVVANNPQEFATQFKQQMSTYLRTKLTESQIY